MLWNGKTAKSLLGVKWILRSILAKAKVGYSCLYGKEYNY